MRQEAQRLIDQGHLLAADLELVVDQASRRYGLLAAAREPVAAGEWKGTCLSPGAVRVSVTPLAARNSDAARCPNGRARRLTPKPLSPSPGLLYNADRRLLDRCIWASTMLHADPSSVGV